MTTKINYLRPQKLDDIAPSSYYAQAASGLLPPPVKLGPRTSGIPEHELDICREAQLAGLSKDEQRSLVRELVESRREFIAGRGDAAIARIREKFAVSGGVA